MKVIELEQIRPKECPINNDNCQGCKYYFGIAKHWDSTDVDCCYDEWKEDVSAKGFYQEIPNTNAKPV